MYYQPRGLSFAEFRYAIEVINNPSINSKERVVESGKTLVPIQNRISMISNIEFANIHAESNPNEIMLKFYTTDNKPADISRINDALKPFVKTQYSIKIMRGNRIGDKHDGLVITPENTKLFFATIYPEFKLLLDAQAGTLLERITADVYTTTLKPYFTMAKV
jgi:hypothetical protein